MILLLFFLFLGCRSSERDLNAATQSLFFNLINPLKNDLKNLSYANLVEGFSADSNYSELLFSVESNKKTQGDCSFVKKNNKFVLMKKCALATPLTLKDFRLAPKNSFSHQGTSSSIREHGRYQQELSELKFTFLK